MPSVFVGTDDGLLEQTLDDGPVEQILDDVSVRQLERSAYAGDLLVATDSGLYRSADGKTWDDTNVTEATSNPIDAVVSVHETADGRVIAGTRPPHLLRSAGPGEPWKLIEAFEAYPGREEWTQNYMGPAQVRDVRSHECAPWKLFVAVETAGVFVGHDLGRSFEYRSRGLDNDPHGLRMIGQDDVIATCGRGLYRTRDAGRTWYRLDAHERHFWHRYFREGIVHDGTYYTCAMDRGRHRFEGIDDGVILKSDLAGGELEGEGFPGDDEDYVTAWASVGDHLLAGTVGGRLLAGPGEWDTIATFDASIRSLAGGDAP